MIREEALDFGGLEAMCLDMMFAIRGMAFHSVCDILWGATALWHARCSTKRDEFERMAHRTVEIEVEGARLNTQCVGYHRAYVGFMVLYLR